jgi:predicted ATPase
MEKFLFRWKNVKSFEDTGWVPSRRLNLLIGPNNSGKSSLLTPLLLLKQTWDSPDPSIALNLHGSLSNSGSYSDLVFRHDVGKSLQFSLNFNEPLPVGERPSLGWLLPSVIDLVFDPGPSPSRIPVLSRYRASDGLGRTLIDRRRSSRGYSMGSFKRVVESMRSNPRFGMADEPLLNSATDRLVATDRPTNFLFTGSEVAQRVFSPHNSHDDEQGDTAPIYAASAPAAPSLYTQVYLSLSSFVSHLFTAHLLRDMAYIGPIRQRARRTYEVLEEIPIAVGSTGERTAELLYHHQSDEMKEGVDYWMREFGLADRIRCNAVADGIFSLVVEQEQIVSNISDSGFGISQVLPLVVSGLAAEEESLLIAEQPEIHLNPRLQGVLADLFVTLALHKRNLIIETHSEHLLLRLRRLIAEGRIDAADIAILFVEKHGDHSAVREVEINSNGSIRPEDWPNGFFEDSMKDAIGLARAQQAN